jgi:hypothetical protein
MVKGKDTVPPEAKFITTWSGILRLKMGTVELNSVCVAMVTVITSIGEEEVFVRKTVAENGWVRVTKTGALSSIERSSVSMPELTDRGSSL